MFYLSELLLRLKYVIISLILTFISCISYKNLLLPIISLSVISTSDRFGNFIYTNPTELLKVQLYLIVIFSLFILLPYLIWNILEFFKSSLFKYEYKKVKILSIFLIIFFYFSNILVNSLLFPKIWLFFENFNFSNNNAGLLSFSPELKIEEYLNFLIDFTFVVNSFLILFLILLFILLKFGVSNLLKWKKLFILLNIVFATLLSPPDVYSQLTILIFLSIVLETNILIFLLFTKITKYYFK